MKKWLSYFFLFLLLCPSVFAISLDHGFDTGPLNATSVTVDCTNFSKNLSCSDDNVQHALNTLDQLSTTAGTVSVLDYGAACDGTTNDTAAFNLAIAAMPKGGTLLVPCNKAAVNLTITQQSLTIRGMGWYGATTTNRTVLVPYSTASPVIQIGNDTGLVRGVTIENIAINGTGPSGTGTIGLYLAGGAYRDSFRNIWIQNFSTNNLKIKAGTSYPTAYIFFDSFVFESTITNTAVVGVYYPTSGIQYTTAIYFAKGSISSAAAGGYALEVDSADVHITDTYLQVQNNGGIHLLDSASPNPNIYANDMTVDADNSGWNTVTGFNTNKVISDYIKGNYTVVGQYLTTDAIQTGTTGSSNLYYQSQLSYPSIVGEAVFVPTSSPAWNSNIHIASGGNDLTMTSSSGYFFDNVGGTNFMRLDLPSGNLGIGTTSNERLAVGVGNISLDNTYAVKGTDNVGTRESMLTITNANNVQLNSPTSGGSIQYQVRNASGAHQWLIGGTNLMQLSSSGNLGIGTIIPQGGLIVMNGNVGIGTWKPIGALDIKTGNNVLIESGNVGIGTTVPIDSLQVNGDASSLSLNHTSTSSYNQIPFREAGVANAFLSYLGTAFGGARQDTLEEYTKSGTDITFLPAGAEAMRIKSGGNVGIGTVNPGFLLDVAGPMRIRNANGNGITFTSNNTSQIKSTGGSNTNLYVIPDGSLFMGGNGGSSWQITSGQVLSTLIDNTYHFGAAGARPVDITIGSGLSSIAGNLGIGSTNPGQVIDVVGNIRLSNYLNLSAGPSAYDSTQTSALIYNTSNGGSTYPFTTAGNLVMQSRPSTGRDIVFSTGTSGNTRMVVDSNGNVGIGTWLPAGLLSVQTGNVAIGTITPGYKLAVNGTVQLAGLTASAGLQTAVLCLDANNQVIADSVACLASSQKFKNTILPIKAGLTEINKLRPVTYHWNKTGNIQWDNDPNRTVEQYGFIAEEVKKIDPLLIVVDDKGNPRTFRYEQYTAVLTKAIQELTERVKKLEHKGE